MSDFDPVYVVVATYNGAQWIRGLLKSLRTSRQPCVPVVVDNGSTDNTISIIEEEFPQTLIIPLPENRGFGVANNVGITYALGKGAEFIFLLNQDAYVLEDTLSQLVGFMSDHPEFGVVSPLHCAAGQERVDPSQQNYLQRFVPSYLSDACLNRIQSYYSVRGVNAAAWLVRERAFRYVGGFDPLFFMYGEDDDLINRLEFHKVPFAIFPSARVVHLRERAPISERDRVGRIRAASSRTRSVLLVDLKQPNGRFMGKCLRFVTNGFLRPLLDVLETRDAARCAAALLASMELLLSLHRVRRNARVCRGTGPHFLFGD
jgi:GT2 family glycosyltransferase